jgi:hypothetical protein
MRRLALIVFLGGLAASCGSGSVKTVTKTTIAPTPTVTATTSTQATGSAGGLPDCVKGGFNEHQLKQGTCLYDRRTETIVDKATLLRLKSLTAKLDGITEQNSLSSGFGQSAVANGKFVVLTITLTNRLDTPQQWQSGQADLFVAVGATGGKNYSEDFNAENGPDQNSCLWKAGSIGSGGIQPAESSTCDVVFDIPQILSPTHSGSGLFIENFGEADTLNPTMPVGDIRLYH